MKFIIIILILSFLSSPLLAKCNTGCKSCSGSICSACKSTYYWHADWEDCYSTCSGVKDYTADAKGGKAVCRLSSSTTSSTTSTASAVGRYVVTQVLSSVIPIVVILILAFVIISIIRIRRKKRLSAVGTISSVLQNSSPISNQPANNQSCVTPGYDSYPQDQVIQGGVPVNPAYSNFGAVSYGEPINYQQADFAKPMYGENHFA